MVPTFVLKALFTPKVIHRERLNLNSPHLIIPNHTSLLDAVLLAISLPKDVVFVANTQIAKQYAWAMKGREVVPIDPMNPYSIRSILRVLRAGKSVVIFPEGRITVTNSLMKIYSGVVYLSLKTGVPLLPIAINGGEKAKKFTYLEGKIPTEWLPKTSLYIGESFHFPAMEDKTMREKKEMGMHIVYRKLQDLLFESRMQSNIHLVQCLQDRVKEAPNMVIAEDMSGKVTMKKLWQNIVGLTHLISPHIPEERIGVLLPTSIACMATTFALMYKGRTPAMLNASMDANTLTSCLTTGGLKTILTSRAFIEKGKLQNVIEACEKQAKVIYLEDLKQEMNFQTKLKVLADLNKKVTSQPKEILLFTSGSEGTPKGVLLTHDNLFANMQQARLMIDLTSKDKIVNALPMFHSFGLILAVLSPLLHVPSVLIPSPLLYKAIPEFTYDKNGTILFGTSTFLSAYGRYAHPYDFARLRYVFCGAEKLQDSVRQLYMEKFGVRVLEGYGLTETSPILAIQTPLLYKKGSVGCLLPAVKHKLEPVEGVEDGGKLLIQAPNLMKGYLIADKGYVPTPEWFDTGDIVSMDEKGFVTIQGRAKRFVKVGGEMVSLSVVEEHAKLAIGEGEVVAVRVSDKRKGERIELVATSDKANREMIREYWRHHNISPLSLPSQLHIVKEIPLLGSGKTDFTTVTKQIQALYEEE